MVLDPLPILPVNICNIPWVVLLRKLRRDNSNGSLRNCASGFKIIFILEVLLGISEARVQPSRGVWAHLSLLKESVSSCCAISPLNGEIFKPANAPLHRQCIASYVSTKTKKKTGIKGTNTFFFKDKLGIFFWLFWCFRGTKLMKSNFHRAQLPIPKFRRSLLPYLKCKIIVCWIILIIAANPSSEWATLTIA